MKIEKPTTDWKREFHKLQEAKNNLYADYAVLKNKVDGIVSLKDRLQSICRKTGWIMLSITGVIIFFDVINLWLGIGKISPGFGYGQLISSVVIGGLGLLLLGVGYYETKRV